MRAIDFEAVLAGVSSTTDDDGLAVGIDGLGCVENQFCAFQTKHFLCHLLCLGTLHGYLTVIVGAMVEVHVEAFEMLLHPCHVFVDIGGIDD